MRRRSVRGMTSGKLPKPLQASVLLAPLRRLSYWRAFTEERERIMSQFTFNDGNIAWKRLDGIDHLLFSVLDIDDRNVLHVLFKLSANQRIVLHRHCALNKTFVIQGEHRLYHANGELKDVRPAGSYTVSPPAHEPHREGGGDQDVVVLFTIYDREGPLYEILDDNSNVVATLSTNDFVSFYDRKH